MLSTTITPIPADEKDFERKCAVLFAGLLGDRNIKTVGGRGQTQHGLDLLGRRDGDPLQPVGVQCKLRTRGDKLSEAEIRREVTAALAIVPPLTEYYIVTTAPDDTDADLLALALAHEQALAGRRIDIQVWGWDTLQQRIREDLKALKAFDPGQSPVSDELLRLGTETLQTTDALVVEVQKVQTILTLSADTSRSAVDSYLDSEIDTYRDLINQGRPRTGLALLDSLQSRLTPEHSAKIRARVTANRGWAKMQLGEERAGAQLLLDAYVINPDDPKTLANRVFGLIMLDSVPEALALAADVLAKDPGNAAVAAFVFQAAAKSDAAIDPLALVPAALLDDETVRLHRLNYARFRLDPAEWQRLAYETYQALPNNDAVEQAAAEAMLHEAFEARGFELHPAPDRANSARLAEAVALLQRQWERVRGFECVQAPYYIAIAVNLANGLRALGEAERAQTVAEQAVAAAPAHFDARITAAFAALELDQPQVAVDHLRAVGDLGAKATLLMMALSRLDRWADVLELARPEVREAAPAVERVTFDLLAFHARARDAAPDEVERLSAALLETWPQSVAAHVAAASASRRTNPGRAAEIAAAAADLLEEKTPYADRVMLSELVGETGDCDTVIAALDGYIDPGRPSRRLLQLAWAFANAAVRPRTHAFFESLGPEVIGLPEYARMAGAGEAARGDLASAERHLRVAVGGDPSDVRAHLMLQSVLQRADRQDEARAFVQATDEAALDGEPMDLMRWAFCLAQNGEAPRGVALGYWMARAHRDDEGVVGGYPILMLTSDSKVISKAIGKVSKAKPDMWFDLAGDGCPDVSGVIETGSPLQDRFDPGHPLAVAVLGKKVGDRVVLPREYGGDHTYTIRALKPKFVWLLHDIGESHATRFPGATNFIQMRVEPGDFTGVTDLLKGHAEDAERIERLYADAPVPLAAIAAGVQQNVLELAEQFRRRGIVLRAATGAGEDHRVAAEMAQGARDRGAVLDLLTASTLIRLELLDPVKRYFGRLVLPRSAIDDLMELRGKHSVRSGSESLSVSIEGGKALGQRVSARDVASGIASLTETLKTLHTQCEVAPTDGSDDLRLDHGAIDRFAAAEVLDPIHLARQQGLLLLSQDLHLRQMAAELGLQTGWLQPVFAQATEANLMTRSQLVRATAQLSALKQGPVSLDVATLTDILRLEEAAEPLFEAAASELFAPGADLKSHLGVSVGFIATIMGRRVEHGRALRAIGTVLDRLLSDKPRWRVLLWLAEQDLRAAARSSPPADTAWRYLRSWSRGRFLGLDFDGPAPTAQET